MIRRLSLIRNVVLLLAQRRTRCANINTTLGQLIVFAVYIDHSPSQYHRLDIKWFVSDAGQSDIYGPLIAG